MRHRCRFAEEADLPFTDALQVGGQARQVAVMAPADGDLVRNTAGRECGQRKGAHFDRVIDQFVIVGGSVEAESVLPGSLVACRSERGGDTPRFEVPADRPLDIDQTRRMFVTEGAQEYAAAIEKSVCLVDMRSAYREIPGVNLADDGERHTLADRCSLPAVFVDLGERYHFASSLGTNRDDVAREVTNQVTAGNPCRQRETLPSRVGCGKRAAHFKKMRCRLARTDAVADMRRPHRLPLWVWSGCLPEWYGLRALPCAIVSRFRERAAA
ncbi:MAG: hypothetical protein AW09_003970 [Candidatus Accumulibacter phosphatis]|uniref:Uncharacterized protein n=1 Tax=Candidatus Accumulibacter phosphatis TaxID=327160 RepID=A0A080LRN4_9PROT|nr:MAG: hypothetical protein AW09_003970 [Candidatus Accumulibacter phosphatis]